MKTLYLHIGTPKTGTTSIQHFCYDNMNRLSEEGYNVFIYVSFIIILSY